MQTATLFAPDKLLYRKIFMCAAQTRNFWKNWVNFFCFWEDNLALAKFQSPTDTQLNHNLTEIICLSKHFEQLRFKMFETL